MNAKGQSELRKAQTGCFFSFMPPNVNVNILGDEKDGRGEASSYFTVANPLEDPSLAKIMDDNRLLNGFQTTQNKQLVPQIPMYVYNSINDYVVPIQGLDQVLETWAQNGV